MQDTLSKSTQRRARRYAARLLSAVRESGPRLRRREAYGQAALNAALYAGADSNPAAADAFDLAGDYLRSKLSRIRR